jgi:hypothetical protein
VTGSILLIVGLTLLIIGIVLVAGDKSRHAWRPDTGISASQIWIARADRAFRTFAPPPPGRPALIKLRVAGDSVLRRSWRPLVIPAFGIRAALRRSPPRTTVLAPILTGEHAYDDEEADDRHQSE